HDGKRRKHFVEVDYRAEVWVAGIRPSPPRRVRDHRLQFLANHRLTVREVDRIAVALAHFPAVSARDFRKLREMFLGLGKYRLLIEVVEASRHFPGQLAVRELIPP